jgi:hypothetical protein
MSLTEKLLNKLEQSSFISEQHILWVYKIQEVKKVRDNLKRMTQLTLQRMFKKIRDCSVGKSDNSSLIVNFKHFLGKKIFINIFIC